MILKNLKTGRVWPRENSTLKIFAETLTPILARLFSQLLVEGVLPEQWHTSEIILRRKKGEITIRLKVFLGVLRARINSTPDLHQIIEQAGCR